MQMHKGEIMFTEEEKQILLSVLQQMTFKIGSSKNMILIENIIMKITDSMKIKEEKK